MPRYSSTSPRSQRPSYVLPGFRSTFFHLTSDALLFTLALPQAILRGISEKYSVHHGVRILDGALVLAAQLAKQYLTQRRLPDSAIDLVDEAASSVKIARETRPEALDNLERKKLEVGIEIHALEREKDEVSKQRLEAAKKALQDIEDQLTPMRAQYEAEKSRGNEINDVRQKIDTLKSKVLDAERRQDLETAADLKFYAIPDLQKRLADLEARKAEKESAGEVAETNIVTETDIAEVVARWTAIPTGRLMSTEKQKLLQMEKILSRSLVGQPEAVKAVSNAVRLNRSGLGEKNRPIASFLLCGPSGTGKTLLAKTLAEAMFNSVRLSQVTTTWLTVARLLTRHLTSSAARRHGPHRLERVL